MNLQEILVYIIIAGSISYTLYSIIKVFIRKDKSTCNCSSCEFKNNIKDLKDSKNFLKKVS